ncbi:hypothetical protein EWM64_g2116 [Hericium alpestre]|uniref:A-kinase anchor protein 7-like phosphoesterase domain-containing protein n=1 Tax=Hericium alpestre TaxID=135208 RepID=A0A4Z0A4D6_9AGAM|nr:hypothetical protein EWM64_g2116 [Hericium alpestre]
MSSTSAETNKAKETVAVGAEDEDEETETSRSGPPDRLTSLHFPSQIQGNHAGLRTALSDLSSSLLTASPPIPGLDTSIVIPPRRAHLTVGVMALPDAAAIERALDVLQSLRSRVAEMLNGRQLSVGLECVDVMRLDPDGGAHVMFAGPDMESAEAQRLWDVASMIQCEFIQSGLMPDERRPLKLHCTLLNTVYRRSRRRAGRIPFSYTDMLASAAFRALAPPAVEVDAIAPTTEAVAYAIRSLEPVDADVLEQTEAAEADTTTPGADTTTTGADATIRRPQNTQPVRVDLGAWSLEEVQLCEMGSWGPEGEYVSVGAIDLM